MLLRRQQQQHCLFHSLCELMMMQVFASFHLPMDGDLSTSTVQLQLRQTGVSYAQTEQQQLKPKQKKGDLC